MEDLNNWRGIDLLDISSKIISSIISESLSLQFLTLNPEDQCAIPGKGCTDGIFSVKMAVQTLHEFDQDFFLLFMDLVKVHDTINRELLFILLDYSGVPPLLVNVVKKLCSNVNIFLNIEGLSKEFSSTYGVKKDDNLVPILFIVLLHFVIKTLEPLWNFESPNFWWFPNTKQGNVRGQLMNRNLNKEGETFTFNLSSCVDDTFYLLSSRENVRAACILIRKYFRRFGLTIYVDSELKKKK